MRNREGSDADSEQYTRYVPLMHAMQVQLAQQCLQEQIIHQYMILKQ